MPGTLRAPARELVHSRPPTMKAAVFREPGRIELIYKPIPVVGPTDALVRVTLTTICGTDVHILKGEYPVGRASPSATSRSG